MVARCPGNPTWAQVQPPLLPWQQPLPKSCFSFIWMTKKRSTSKVNCLCQELFKSSQWAVRPWNRKNMHLWLAFPIVCGLPLPCKHPSVKIRNWSTLRRILNFMETMDGKRTSPQLVTHCWTLKTQGVMPPTSSALLLLMSSYPLLVLNIPHCTIATFLSI